MHKNHILSFTSPNAFLLLCLILMVSFTPMLPVSYYSVVYHFFFSCIFLLSALSLQHVQKQLLIAVALVLVAITWIAFKIEVSGLFLVSRISQGLFSLFIIVIQLIRQTATAKNVHVRVIADSINGYLLVGVIYSINDDKGQIVLSKIFYYTFVMLHLNRVWRYNSDFSWCKVTGDTC